MSLMAMMGSSTESRGEGQGTPDYLDGPILVREIDDEIP